MSSPVCILGRTRSYILAAERVGRPQGSAPRPHRPRHRGRLRWEIPNPVDLFAVIAHDVLLAAAFQVDRPPGAFNKQDVGNHRSDATAGRCRIPEDFPCTWQCTDVGSPFPKSCCHGLATQGRSALGFFCPYPAQRRRRSSGSRSSSFLLEAPMFGWIAKVAQALASNPQLAQVVVAGSIHIPRAIERLSPESKQKLANIVR